MKLTRRQMDCLGEINDLQRQNQGDPVHYSDLAQRLDISKSTAYYMLRMLEEKGCVASQYQLPEVRIGRSSRVFEMSEMGQEVLSAADGGQ